jgi:transcriptional regulator with GAF, ATPase, and Fis domain
MPGDTEKQVESQFTRTSSAFSIDKDLLIKSILRISTFLTAPSSVEDILSKILDEAVDTMGFDRGIILLLDEQKENLITKVVKNYNPEEAVQHSS